MTRIEKKFSRRIIYTFILVKKDDNLENPGRYSFKKW